MNQEQKSGKVTPPHPILGEVPADLRLLDGEGGNTRGLPTLAQVGKRLPVGFVDERGQRHLDFELVTWSGEIEEQLGNLAEREGEMSLFVYMSEVIGTGLKRLGDVDVTSLKRSERRLLVRRMYMADAIFVYIWIRIEALGHRFRLRDFTCSACGQVIPTFDADLRSLEVKIHEEVPRKGVKLERGVEYAGEVRRSVTVEPVRWSFLEDLPSMSNPWKVKVTTIQQGVTGIEGAPPGPIHLTPERIKTMNASDLNLLVREIDDIGGGPVMEVRGTHEGGCGREFVRTLPWTYDRFFAPSSQ